MSKNKELLKIKNLIGVVLPRSRVILFGSRGRGESDFQSDYDLLVVSKGSLDIKEKRRYAGKIRKKLAVAGIPADVLVKTEQDVFYYENKIGSVVREAVMNGITL